MSVTSRQVKNKRDANGKLTGRSGVVYDVNIKYKVLDGYKAHVKRGFAKKSDAVDYEAAMKVKLSTQPVSVLSALSREGNQTLQAYITKWVERHGSANLRSSTLACYKNHIKNHIIPALGLVRLKDLTPEQLDDFYNMLSERHLSSGTIKIDHRILSAALEAARKYHYIERNPTRDIITKFIDDIHLPEPYTVQQMKQFMKKISGTSWELTIILAGLYGLRISEILGLRWDNVDLVNGTITIKEQLPYKLEKGNHMLPDQLPPAKSKDRVLPITAITKPYFEQCYILRQGQKEQALSTPVDYFDNRLVVCHENGRPFSRSDITVNFQTLLQSVGLPHIRFHDLRHTAATNMHDLTGDFFTVSQILGHSLSTAGVTAKYVNVRMDRKKAVLSKYHQEVLTKRKNRPKER